jgi:alpha-galactosidase
MAARTYKAAGFDPDRPLLQMPDFNSLIASSQEHQVPIFELTPQQLEQQGRVLAITQTSQDRFRTLFDEAADRVLRVVDANRD